MLTLALPCVTDGPETSTFVETTQEHSPREEESEHSSTIVKQSSTDSDATKERLKPIKIKIKAKKKSRKRHSSPPTSPLVSDPSSPNDSANEGPANKKRKKRQIEQMDHYR